MGVVMTFLKKTLIGVVLSLVIGASTICMDTNNSAVPEYYLEISPKTGSQRELEILRIFIKAAGGEVIHSSCQNVHAFLPSQLNVGESFVKDTLSSKEWSYIFRIRERACKGEDKHYLKLERMGYTPEDNLSILKRIIEFAGGRYNSTGSIVHAYLPDQATVGDDFVEQAAQMVDYKCLLKALKGSKAPQPCTIVSTKILPNEETHTEQRSYPYSSYSEYLEQSPQEDYYESPPEQVNYPHSSYSEYLGPFLNASFTFINHCKKLLKQTNSINLSSSNYYEKDQEEHRKAMKELNVELWQEYCDGNLV